MMDFSSLFSSSDNFYKFLFVGGIAMIFVSLAYPLQKQQAIDIEINVYNQQAELLNRDVSRLQKDINVFKKTKQRMLDTLNGYKADFMLSKTSKDLKIAEIKRRYALSVMRLQHQEQANVSKYILIKYNKQKIAILEQHERTYEVYTFWLTFVGVITGLLGGILWAISTWNTELLKKSEIKLKSSELKIPRTTKTK